jgi:dipeptidyl aminopeptidase/acylaminoacyl peptidase
LLYDAALPAFRPAPFRNPDMSFAVPTSCGAWPSPLSPEGAAAGAVALSNPGLAAGVLHWVEGRPAERGRNALVRRLAGGGAEDVLGPQANVRTRVHEYGGWSWAAVGGRLLYAQFDDQRLRVVQPGGAESVLTPAGCRYADFHAAPDGHTLVAVREDHRAGGEAINTVVRLDTRDAQDEGQVLFGGSDFVAWPRLSADGRCLAVVAWDHPSMPWDDTRLMMADLSAGPVPAWHCVAGGPGESVAEPQWGDDGSLYFLSDRTGWWNLYRWKDGHTQALTAEAAEFGAPLWQLGQRSFALLPGRRALLRRTLAGVDTLCLLQLDNGSLRALDLPYVSFSSPGALDADHAYVLAAAADDLPALVSIDLRDGSHRVLRHSGRLPMPADAVAKPRSIDFATRPGPDGAPRQAQAWFYPPHLPGHAVPAGERPPLIVMLHGGPTSHVGPAFKVGVQFWTSRGFAVVDVNYGGSTSFGRAYRERLRGQWGVVDLQDAVAAVDDLVARGWVDGGRVAIRGGSAGGFSVLCGLAFTDRFAAGINYFGVADLETLATDTHKFESRYLDSLVAPLPEGRAVYRERSPVLHMNRCHGALLTLQGSDDKAVPPQQSRAIVDAARAAGCPVAYVEFEGEGHGFRQAANLVRAMQLELAFLGRVFGFQPAGGAAPIEIDNASALG